MLVEDQAATIAFLAEAAAREGKTADIVRIQTHISLVVLAGARAFKLKRAVRLPYVDFATSERRLADCLRELELNRRTAPMLYRGVRRITREADGRLAFDGCGQLVDAVVEMARFDQETLFDRMALRGALTPMVLTELARVVAGFHADAAVDHSRSGNAVIGDVLDINERALATTQLFPRDGVTAFNAAFRSTLRNHGQRLDARERKGKVRRCHGDLHLRNICLVDDKPVLFDCLEFDDALATIDVLYDLAFLLMDLWHRGLRASANLVCNRYLDVSDEVDGLPLVPLFMAIRAAVRAHVGATQADEADAENRASIAAEASAYFELALDLLVAKPAMLMVIGGRSGTGKSTVAAALAHRIGSAPGARVLSSDRIRKQLFGVAAETPLPKEAYRPAISKQVYARMAELAREALNRGQAVIVDAVFDRPESRLRIEAVATQTRVPFVGLWLEAAPAALMARVGARQNDASDANAEVVRLQLAHDPGPIAWRRIETGAGPAAAVAEAAESLGLQG